MKVDFIKIFVAFICATFLVTVACYNCSAQVFGFRGGVVYSMVKTKEMIKVDPMLNYFYELYYNKRLYRGMYWGIGGAYSGGGGKLYGYDVASLSNYNVKARFNYFLIPATVKISREGRNKLRPYGFISVAPAYMFTEERDYEFEKPLPRQSSYVYQWDPRRLNIFFMVGGGVYWKHFTVDFSFASCVLRNYKQTEAPVSYNMGPIVTVGYQVSRATNKMW